MPNTSFASLAVRAMRIVSNVVILKIGNTCDTAISVFITTVEATLLLVMPPPLLCFYLGGGRLSIGHDLGDPQSDSTDEVYLNCPSTGLIVRGAIVRCAVTTQPIPFWRRKPAPKAFGLRQPQIIKTRGYGALVARPLDVQ